MPMLRTMRAPANAEVMFHFLALSEMTAARCTVKAIHENEGLFCRLMKLSHTIARLGRRGQTLTIPACCGINDVARFGCMLRGLCGRAG